MNAKIHVVGINRTRDALLLREKLMQARREAGRAKKDERLLGKEALAHKMAEAEANFIAQGMSQASRRFHVKSGVRKPTAEELALINQHFAKRELKEDEIYVFDVDAANDKTLTSYFSHLGRDMIDAFHANVQGRQTNPKAFSVGYLFGHNKEMIPSGTLFNSEVFEEAMAEGEMAAHFRPTVFMLKNLNVGGINTDDYIKAYEAGHTEAVSVSFLASSYICDLCGNDVRDFFKCEHMPGRLYNMAKEGDPPVMKQATYTVHQGYFRDRNLAELSGVYAPALPGAQIEAGQMSAKDDAANGYFVVGKDGEAKPSGKVLMSRNIKDFQKDDLLRFNHAGDGVIELMGRLEMKKEEEKHEEVVANLKNEAQKAQAEAARALEEVSKLQAEVVKLQGENKGIQDKLSALVDKHAKLDEEHNRLVKVLAQSEMDKVALSEKLEAATKEVERLSAENANLKKTIEEYVNSLKKEAEEWDVRLNGTNHNSEIFAKEINALSIDELKQKIESLKKQVGEKYPHGRHSLPNPESGPKQPERPAHDRAELYKIS